MSPAEKKAIKNLNGIIKYAPTEQKKNTLNRAIKVIKKGTFANKSMPKLINDFFKTNQGILNNINLFYDKLFKNVLDRYNLLVKDKESESPSSRSIINPKIVLTQSFE